MSDHETAPPALSMRGITKVFGGVTALSNVDFEVAAGEVHCLAGENGSGKSTLIKIATGVETPEPGAVIEVGGERVEHPTPALARRLGIGIIWQDLALFPEMTVAENIAVETILGAPHPISERAMRRTAERAMERLGVTLDLNRPVRALPIAKRQIVAIARALVADVKLIFMDEPTASLTYNDTEQLLEIVRGLSSNGVAVVFVSHRLTEVLDISQNVTVLRDGEVVGVYPAADMTPSRLGELMTGRQLYQNVTAEPKDGAEPVLEVERLSRAGEYENVSFTIRRGEILGLVGLVGAGRTEIGLTLFGMTQAEEGTIRLNGETVRFTSNGEAIDAGVAYVSEDRLALGLVQPQPISDNIAITVLSDISTAGLISTSEKDDTVEHWIDELSVKIGRPHDAVATLSGGNQQRIVLAKWLATKPKLLILDCPTVGVDVGARAGIFKIVRRLAEDGLAILLISDETSEVHFNADRVLVMQEGRIVGEHDPTSADLEALEEAVYA